LSECSQSHYPLPPADLLTQQAEWLAPARARLLRHAAVAHRRRVLDLGAGSGAVTGELARRSSGYVVALDNSFYSLRENRAVLATSRPVCGNALALPFPAATFDLIFCQCALLWMQPAETTIREIWRVLQTGGVLVALEPDYGAMIEQPAALATREIWLAVLIRAGADPLIGRRLPSLLDQQGFQVRVQLLDELQPPSPTRFAFLRGLPLSETETAALNQIEQEANQLSSDWQQVAHLPFFLITAEKRAS
jgi:SAM-dependent methyltransferase